MSLQHFSAEIDKGLGAPVYFLSADDPYFLKEASLLAAQAIPPEERDFSFFRYDFDSSDETPSLAQVVDILNTIPFFGKRKIVILENVQELTVKEKEALEEYVLHPAPHAVLILLHRGKPKAYWREIQKKAKSVSLDLRQQDFPAWIRRKAQQRGVELTTDAVEYLIGIVGPDAGLISSEIEKIALVATGRVSMREIAGMVQGSGEHTAFDLVHALMRRDADEVMKLSRELQASQDAYMLVGAVNWGYSRAAARDKTRPEYYDRVFQLLNEADIGIKTSGGVFPLEYLLVKLLRV